MKRLFCEHWWTTSQSREGWVKCMKCGARAPKGRAFTLSHKARAVIVILLVFAILAGTVAIFGYIEAHSVAVAPPV